jgi:CRP/FNR family transcriptional regulator, cyclic AMP receptor protein
MQVAAQRNEIRAESRAGEFFKSLPPEALSDFKSLEYLAHHSGNTILFLEGETSTRVLVLLEGKVKLSINSIDGRRLILRIAHTGEILALNSALSGGPYAITAETLHPCTIAALRREDFLSFLLRYPIAYQGAARELSLDYTRACERLHTIRLQSTAQIKLARLLLEWCADGQQTGCGTRIKLSLTHKEIGECIGCSRETVTRTMNDFKHQHLLDHHGATLVIPNRVALESYADIDRPRGSISHPAKSTPTDRAAA